MARISLLLLVSFSSIFARWSDGSLSPETDGVIRTNNAAQALLGKHVDSREDRRLKKMQNLQNLNNNSKGFDIGSAIADVELGRMDSAEDEEEQTQTEAEQAEIAKAAISAEPLRIIPGIPGFA
mmetsp:Transcript_20206/g.28191  ORF Transcript_20206/g.28191 Transcript_20206/m.28191 type:complete len:124 (+) Transcript_20206:133-504(+)|eukprot:CAMPEP_0184479034 /NCGR_PEP_ID=MMETSP0113_2-20130426/891_1 /TAXON_ID=91329 /ORGANISM="Norrisiella sphaerica, Strain BC52" /LENGTH=123 /DNA_ID=CAMNT_0026857015 /DNA_START=133 /DNA_END=504 /DNA_ORIENTATION=+